MAVVSHQLFLIAEGILSLLSLLKWPVVVCILTVSFFPNHASARTQSSANALTVEQTVRAAYADVPVLIQIAKCESRFRQYDENGKVLYNEQGSSAVGVMQIMSSIHSSEARRLGYDITTTEGNLGYARHLYEHQGTSPWNASAYCWS